MPFTEGSKIVFNPYGFVEDRYVCTNAKNFAYEHEETERHKPPCHFVGKNFLLSLTGFTGSSCDENINECDSSPCENSFSCIDATLDYVCDC